MATFKIVLDKRVRLATGEYNLVVRVFNRNKHLDLRITRISLDEYTKVFKRHAIDKRSIDLRDHCQLMLSKTQKIFGNIGRLDKERIRHQYYNSAFIHEDLSLREMFEFYRNTKSNRMSTYERMSSSMNAVNRFRQDVLLCDIDLQFINAFSSFLRLEEKSISTIASYQKDLRTIINHSKKFLNGFPKDYVSPFENGGYSIPSGYSRKKVIDLKEVEKVLNFRDFQFRFDEFALDIWQLLFYCNGINFIDALLLKWSNIEHDRINLMRRKTVTTRKNNLQFIQIALDSDIMSIIEKWGKRDRKYVFGLIERENDEKYLYAKNKHYRRKINKSLDRITNELNLSVPLRLATARDSYATSLYRNGASKSKIGEAMGHSNMKVTEHYFGSLGLDEISELNQLLPRKKT